MPYYGSGTRARGSRFASVGLRLAGLARVATDDVAVTQVQWLSRVLAGRAMRPGSWRPPARARRGGRAGAGPEAVGSLPAAEAAITASRGSTSPTSCSGPPRSGRTRRRGTPSPSPGRGPARRRGRRRPLRARPRRPRARRLGPGPCALVVGAATALGEVRERISSRRRADRGTMGRAPPPRARSSRARRTDPGHRGGSLYGVAPRPAVADRHDRDHPAAYAEAATALVAQSLTAGRNVAELREIASRRRGRARRSPRPTTRSGPCSSASARTQGDLAPPGSDQAVPPSTGGRRRRRRRRHRAHPARLRRPHRPHRDRTALAAEASYAGRGPPPSPTPPGTTSCGWVVDVRGNASDDSAPCSGPSPPCCRRDGAGAGRREGHTRRGHRLDDAVRAARAAARPARPGRPARRQPVTVLTDGGRRSRARAWS